MSDAERAAHASSTPGWVRAYERRPNRTFGRLVLPMLLSLVAEPLTGVVDTAFVARLGAAPLAALGAGATLLSGLFWIFNFLHINTQTQVARALGAEPSLRRAAPVLRQATGLAIAIGVLAGMAGLAGAGHLASAMGARGEVHTGATLYLQIRLLAAPAVLVTMAAFGALRGAADMKTPLVVAIAMNALNIALDAWWIPRFGIAGAAWATALSQLGGAAFALAVAVQRLGWHGDGEHGALRRFLVAGGDIFARTLALNLFLILGTAVATRAGAIEGSAHQAVRTVWTFAAFLLDAYAATAQTLIAHFVGCGRIAAARGTAVRACVWGALSGVAISLAMVFGEEGVQHLLVPDEASAVFASAWVVAIVFQPLNALAFVTDGIHWGTSDFAYMRNGMALASAVAGVGLWAVDAGSSGALAAIWGWTGLWITLRAGWGVARLWPGTTRAPLGAPGGR